MEDILKENILEVCKNKYQYLMSLRNVVGVGLGYKYINSVRSSMPCIHVLVHKKLHSSCISKDNLVPKNYLGIVTDVLQSGTFYDSGLTNRIRPLQGGYGISTKDAPEKFSGTMGCIVTRGRISKDYFILTNNHVLIRNDIKKITPQVLQPAFGDGGVYPKDFIATLSRYVPLKFKTALKTPINYMDCAIAKLENSSLKSNIIAKLGKVKGKSNPVLEESIKMVGSTTGLTLGHVLTTGVSVSVKYSSAGGRVAFFKDQVNIGMKTHGGDSGSVVLNSKNEVVGLYFSGNDQDNGLMTPIKPVLESLNVDIYK